MMMSSVLLSMLSLSLYGQAPQVDTPKHPNIIFVFPDQLRGSAVQFRGMEPVQTPHLNKFAKESIDLPQCASNYPVCSPFRAMLMSGQYSFKNGVYGNCQSFTAPNNCELPTDKICWSDVLRSAGYELGYIGKWHLDAPYKPYVDCGNNRGKIAWNEWCPPERRHGFQYWHSYGTYDNHMNPLYWDTDSKRNDFSYVKEYGPKYEVDRAIDYISNKGGKMRDVTKPFALVISMNPPHTGYDFVPQKYKDMYRDLDVDSVAQRFPNVPPANSKNGKFFRNALRNYYAQITAVDDNFGRLMNYLDSEQLTQNTIVIFTSDHGDCMGMHEHVGKNVPYECAMSVPCLIRYPEKLKPRMDSSIFLSSPDFAPTMLGLCGLQSRIPPSWDGFDWSRKLENPALTGTFPDGQLYIHITTGYPVKDHIKRLHDSGMRGWRNAEWIYYIERNQGNDKEYLFNRNSDPFQLRNIASEHPDVCEKLKAKVYHALTQYQDQYWQK